MIICPFIPQDTPYTQQLKLNDFYFVFLVADVTFDLPCFQMLTSFTQMPE